MRQKNDILVCVNNNPNPLSKIYEGVSDIDLTMDTEYQIVDVVDMGVYVINDKGNRQLYYNYRFKTKESIVQRDKIRVFGDRMKKLGIDIKLAGNFPWIYIDTINGKRVKEKFHAEHGFTIAFLPIREEQKLEFTDIGEIFKLIRKYVKED